MNQPATSSEFFLNSDKPAALELPDIGEDSLRLLKSDPPTFEQQIAHARMLMRWRREQGLVEPECPRNPAQFEL